ncbi:MAG: methyltransferase [Candidatus Aminicenantes bacterium]|nr:methyltransferase [Acidobacteriota bacterium]MCG2810470.1 methyltransferase [Candidatus Aminicenantes bacterium]
MTEPLTTSDTFYHGKVIIKQLKKGYRFAVDSPILADFLPGSRSPALEIGCGAGVISLLALEQKKFPAVTGIEIQDVLYRLAVENAAANSLSDKFHVIHGDFKRIHPGIQNVQTIFCNPPFFKTGQGRVSPDPTIRLARFEIALTLADLLSGCAAILAPQGKLCLIFPFSRQKELLAEAKAHGLYPAKMRLLHPFADSVPDRLLVQLKKTERSCRIEEPLVVFKVKGIYSPEMERIFAGPVGAGEASSF